MPNQEAVFGQKRATEFYILKYEKVSRHREIIRPR